MAEPKDKTKPRESKSARAATERFDPYWNNRSGTVDSKEQYVQNAAREPKGFHRGARIRIR